VLSGDLEAARQAERRLRAAIPGSARAYQLSLALAVTESRWTDAKRLADDALRAYPENAELWGLAAVSAKKQQQWEPALRALDRAIALADEPLQYRLLRIEVNQERGDLDATLVDLMELIDNADAPEAPIVQLTKLLYERDGYEATIASLQRYIAQYPHFYSLQTLHVDLSKSRDAQQAGELLDRYIQAAANPAGLLFYRVTAALANNNITLAQQDLVAILNHPETDEKATYEAQALLAEIAWLTQDWQTAEDYVDQVLKANAAHEPALLLKAKLLIRHNRSDDAAPYLNKMLSINRNSVEAMELLAAHYRNQGKAGVAADYYQKILERDPQNYEAMRFAIAESFNKGHYANADALLGQALQTYPNDTSLLSVKLQIAAMTGNYKDAEALLKKLQEQNIDRGDVLFFQGFIKQRQGNHKAAMTHFGDAVKLRGEYDKALRAMSVSAAAVNEQARFKTFLREHVDAHANDLGALLLLTQLTDEPDMSGLIPRLEKALQDYPDWGDGAVVLADLYQRAGNGKAAMDLLTRQYQRNTSVSVGIAYARHLEQEGAKDRAAEVYEALIQRYIDNPIVRNNYALFLIHHLDSPQSHRKALQLTESFASSENPALLDTYATVLLKNDNPSRAIFTFQKALGIANLPQIRLHYAQALIADGRKTTALRVLQELEGMAVESNNKAMQDEVALLKEQLQ
jgi:predicted Zn-dependent protease